MKRDTSVSRGVRDFFTSPDTPGRLLRRGMERAAVSAVRNGLLAVAGRAVDQMLDQSRRITHAEPR